MSRTAQVLIIALLAMILLAACAIAIIVIVQPGAKPEPTAVAGPTSTGAPAPPADDSWDKVQAAGRIVVGTAADYEPFEYYTADARIDGFDIALMDEIGRRLGIQVEYRDFAFDGLGSALQLGQIDAAIAAVSVTSERESFVDFSNVYFVGQDSVLASDASPITSVDEAGDLAQLRVGAQRSTVYDDWLHTNLVATGQLPADNLLVYQKADDAVRDLREGRVDLVMLDAQPAQNYQAQGGVKVVGGGLNLQRYAIALPKGAASLKSQIDGVLNQLQNEGFVANLAKQYLDVDHILPTPTPGPTPVSTSTPAPPPACLDGLAWIQHLNYDDQNMSSPPVMKPGQPFTKGWRVQNTGTCTWDSSYHLVYGGGNDPAARMNGQPVAVAGTVPPGATYDIEINLVAPLQPGVYQAFWQMEARLNQAPSPGSGQGFGERLPVGIQVPAHPNPTPLPTQTPVPGISFTVDRTNIIAGECVVFSWDVQNVQDVYFYAEGEDWQKNGVVGQGSQTECPPHTMTYYLRVVMPDGSVQTRQITVYVDHATQAPVIERFTVDPDNQITLGQCVDIRWSVTGDVSSVRISSNGNSLWDGAPVQGQMQDCPTSLGNVAYGIEATGSGGNSQGKHTVYVVGEATATPVPPPPPNDPVIQTFSVSPEQIPAGSCISLKWKTGGGTSWVNIFCGETTVWENAPLQGSVQDCPETPGTVDYRLIAYNPQDQRVHEDRVVTVQ
jgi:polar amino acid transport system substrate-binding protein